MRKFLRSIGAVFMALAFLLTIFPAVDAHAAASAVLEDKQMNGYIGEPLTDAVVKLRLNGDTFNEIGDKTDVTSWLASSVPWLSAEVQGKVSDGDSEISIVLTGTPTAELQRMIRFNIPADCVNGGTAVYAENAHTMLAVFVRTYTAELDTNDLLHATAKLSRTSYLSKGSSIQLTIQPENGVDFQDGLPTVTAENATVEFYQKGHFNFYYFTIKDITGDVKVKVTGEAKGTPTYKAALDAEGMKNATVKLSKSADILPWENVVGIIEAGENRKFESAPIVTVENGTLEYLNKDGDSLYYFKIAYLTKDVKITVSGDTVEIPKKSYAAIENTMIRGTAQEELIPQYGTLVLENDAFHAMKAGQDISAWFNTLPQGVRVAIAEDVEEGAVQAKLVFTGTPQFKYNHDMAIAIAADCLLSGKQLGVQDIASGWDIKEEVNVPVITKGNGAYDAGSPSPIILICSRDKADLYGIYVNGYSLGIHDYTVTSGSTILKLNTSYLKTLTNGTYTVRFLYNDGQYADTQFTISGIAKAAKNTTPAKVKKPTASKQTATSPNTADTTSMGILLSLLICSGAGMLCVERKRKSQQ